MKIVCDSCRAQYLVPDEKVGPKGVKIRCKKCGHIVVWRPGQEGQSTTQPQSEQSLSGLSEPFAEKSGESDELGQAFDRLLQESPRGGSEPEEEDDEDGGETQLFSMEELQKFRKSFIPLDDQKKIDDVFSEAASSKTARTKQESEEEWYIAVRNEQVGPISRKELEDFWHRGEINAQTLAWCQGMVDWEPIDKIPGLRYLVTTGAVSTSAPSTQKEWVETASSALSSLVEEELQAVTSKPPPTDSSQAKKSDLDEEDRPEELPPWEKEDVVSGEVARPGGGYFDPSLSLPTTASGYLPRKTDIEKPAYLAGSGGMARWKVIVAGVVGSLVGAMAIFLFLWGGGKQQQAETAKLPAVTPGSEQVVAEKKQPLSSAETERAKPPAAESKETSAASSQTEEEATAKEEDVIVAQKPRKEPPSTEEKPKVQEKARPVTGGGKPAKPKPVLAAAEKMDSQAKTKADSPPPSAPEQSGLTKEQVNAVMKKYLPVMVNCKEMQKERDPSVTGTMIISFVIQPNGKASDIKVQTPEHQGTFVASCITRVISEINFPTFSGPPFPVPRLSLKLGD